MKTTELEQVIRDYLKYLTHQEYIDNIEIQPLSPCGYSVKLYTGVRNKPITIYAELEDKKFLEFLKKELRSRNFHMKFYGEINLRDKYDCTPSGQPCCRKN